MRVGKKISLLLGAGVVTLVLFDVSINPEFAMPRESELADPRIEAEYARCFRARDEEIHGTAFGTIDNPDVQKEFITSSRAEAARACRALHPERTITVAEPFRFNLVDLEPRFW